MKRFGALALVAALAGAGGCASSAKYVEKKPDHGIVAVPDDSNDWPSYNRREALALIEKHVGPNYEIVDERTVPVVRNGRNGLPGTNETLNPRNAALPARRPTSTGSAEQQEGTQLQITYRRKDGPTDGAVTAAGGTTVQTQYPSSVQPAGGAGPRGTGSYLMPSLRPGPSGADCKE